MPRNLTTQEFIIKARAVHGHLYDYSATTYSASNLCVDIVCYACGGSFSQRPNAHLAGTGCPHCSRTASGLKRRGNTDDFVGKATKVHGAAYDYSLVEYNSAKDKVKVVCRKHGEFLCTPEKHLQGKGCRRCGTDRATDRSRSNTEDFVSKASLLHGDTYDYREVVYGKSGKEKVVVICRLHGGFPVTPTNHLKGRGCPSCKKSGYRPAKAGSIYVLLGGGYVKVGITNRDVNLRCRDISKSSGIPFRPVLVEKLEDGAAILRAETEVLADLRKMYTNPDNKFDGSSECFQEVDVDHVILRVKDAINNITQKCGQ